MKKRVIFIFLSLLIIIALFFISFEIFNLNKILGYTLSALIFGILVYIFSRSRFSS